RVRRARGDRGSPGRRRRPAAPARRLVPAPRLAGRYHRDAGLEGRREDDRAVGHRQRAPARGHGLGVRRDRLSRASLRRYFTNALRRASLSSLGRQTFSRSAAVTPGGNTYSSSPTPSTALPARATTHSSLLPCLSCSMRRYALSPIPFSSAAP